MCDRDLVNICIARTGELSAAGIETFIRAHIERISPITSFIYGNREFIDGKTDEPIGPSLVPFLIRHRIAAVLAEYGITGVRVMDACAQTQIPLIVQFHGFDAYTKSILDYFQTYYRRLFRLTSAIISPSHSMIKQLVKLGAPPEKVHYNPCGVDIDYFVGARPDKSAPLYVAVGRLVEKKAPHLTLMAFRKTLDQIPQSRLLMIGDGPMRGVCENLADTLKISGSVGFYGICSQENIAETLKSARVFVQHSITASDGDSEASPVSIKEAGASGLPVVSTYHAGIPEIVVHGETGYLVAERDVDGMANYMISLGKDPELAARLGRAARQRITEHFSMDNSITHLTRIIEEAVRRRESRKHFAISAVVEKL